MKRMICDTLLVAGALVLVAVLGALVEGTMPMAAALGLLGLLSAGLWGITRLDKTAARRVHRGHGRYRPARTRHAASESLRAA